MQARTRIPANSADVIQAKVVLLLLADGLDGHSVQHGALCVCVAGSSCKKEKDSEGERQENISASLPGPQA
jgi:hypothetical protein